MRALAIAMLAISAMQAGCIFEPTEVLIAIGTDVPAAVPLAITVRVSRGRTASASPTVQYWQRALGDGGVRVDGGIHVPATFAVVPGSGARDGPVFVEIEADAGGVILRRRVSFPFVLRETLTLHVFLTARCLALTAGCSSPGLCTVLRRCEDQSRTCGDEGACIDVGQTLRSDRDGSFGDIGPILCGTYGETCCHVGTACSETLSCVADRCQRCTDSAEACCSGPDLRANGAMCAATSSSGLVPGTCSNGVCSRVLEAPMSVVARADSSSAITVSWTAATGAATYTVETSSDAGFGAPTSTAGVLGTMQASIGFSPGRRYFARVRSVAADGQQSGWSAVVSAVTAIEAPGTPSVSVSIPGGSRLTSDCCWVDPPTPAGMYYYAQAHAGSSCPAGTSIEYRFQSQYTSPATLYGWTGWMGTDAFMTRPNNPWGVRFFAQAHCVGPGATSAESGTGVGCRLSSGGGC